MQPRREQVLARVADLVLDLTLLPARRRRARRRLDQVMRAHRQKAAVEAALLADEHRVDRRRHVVVDAAPAHAAKQAEGVVVRVEHHLLGLARIGPHQEHPAVAEPDVGDLDRRRHPAEHHHLVRPVELIGLARREPQRDEHRALLRALPGANPAHDAARCHRRPGTPRRAAARTTAAPSAARAPAACCWPPAIHRAERQTRPAEAAAEPGARSETRSMIPGSPCAPSSARSAARARSGGSACDPPKTPA